MKTRFLFLSLLPFLGSLVPAQTSFVLRLSPKVTFANGVKAVVPMELTNTGTVPLRFGASSLNLKWGLSGMVVPPKMTLGLPLTTYFCPANASSVVPAGFLTNTGPSFGLYLPGGLFVHVNANPPSNASAYMKCALHFGTAPSILPPTTALPGSRLAVKSGTPGKIAWGVSWRPGWKYYKTIKYYVGARGACLVLCGNVKSGSTFVTNVFGPVKNNYLIFWSRRPGGLSTPWGRFLLDPTSTIFFMAGTIGTTGAGRSWFTVPPGVPPGITLYMQALVFHPSFTGFEFTNFAQVTSS